MRILINLELWRILSTFRCQFSSALHALNVHTGKWHYLCSHEEVSRRPWSPNRPLLLSNNPKSKPFPFHIRHHKISLFTKVHSFYFYSYLGGIDPIKHVWNFCQVMSLFSENEVLLCRASPNSLDKKPWFGTNASKLYNIASFEQICTEFIKIYTQQRRSPNRQSISSK